MNAIPQAQHVAKSNGWWGMAVFIATEATLFGTLIGSYYDLRFNATQWPPAGVPDPKVTLPLILLAVLVATSLPVQLASNLTRAARLGPARLALLLALVLQCGYLGLQIHLYVDDVHKFTPQGSSYGSIYFTLVGAHHAHVFVGILLEAWFLLRLLGGVNAYRARGMQATAFYWHAVNVLAVAVTVVQLSPSL